MKIVYNGQTKLVKFIEEKSYTMYYRYKTNDYIVAWASKENNGNVTWGQGYYDLNLNEASSLFNKKTEITEDEILKKLKTINDSLFSLNAFIQGYNSNFVWTFDLNKIRREVDKLDMKNIEEAYEYYMVLEGLYES